MSVEIEEKRPLSERLQDTFRLNVIEEETLKEVKSFRFTLMNIYALFATAFLILAIIIVSLIFFTPIKRLVPGFGDIKENREFVELSRQVAQLEEELETQQVYTNGLMNMLSGGEVSQLNIPNISPLPIDTAAQVKPSANLKIGEVAESKQVQDLSRLVFIPPVKGSISAYFSRAIDHLGVDVLAEKDTPIKAVSDGIVITSDWTLETGNTIGIQHDNNLVSFYKHNSVLLKKTGDYVTAGEAIAIIGNTGTLSDGPHLHFELWYNGKAIDPRQVINFSN